MIKVVNFIPEHFEKIKLRDCHKKERIPGVASGMLAITMLVGDQPIAIVGAYPVGPGVAQAWGLVSDDVKKFPFSFHKTTRLLMDFYAEKLSLHRIQISVRRDYPVGWRWAKALGFSVEGIMKKYGPDQADYWLFARTTWQHQ